VSPTGPSSSCDVTMTTPVQNWDMTRRNNWSQGLSIVSIFRPRTFRDPPVVSRNEAPAGEGALLSGHTVHPVPSIHRGRVATAVHPFLPVSRQSPRAVRDHLRQHTARRIAASPLCSDLQVFERHARIDRDLARKPENTFADYVSLNLVGPSRNSHLE
jgi:hypothetical protein